MKTKTELKTYFETGDKPTQDQFYEWMDSYWHKEEKITFYEHQIRGKVFTNTNVNGVLNCDLNSYTSWFLTLTGDTTIAFSNMIADDESLTVSMTIKGDFTIAFPAWVKISPYSDVFDGTKVNKIVLEISKGGIAPSGWVNITKMDS